MWVSLNCCDKKITVMVLKAQGLRPSKNFYYTQGTNTQQHNCVTGKAKLNNYCNCRASGRRITQQREQLPFIREACESLLFLAALALL